MAAGGTMTLGELLRRYRLAASLSQEALAERAGLSAAAVAALERGRRTAPRPDTIALLADALALDAADRAALIDAATQGRSSEPAPASSPAPSPPPAPIRGLPALPGALIGREHEAAAVTRLLQPGDGDIGARLLTLTGPGGVGKTRLALATAEALRGAYADGIAFVDLAPLRDPDLVAAAIVQSLDLREEGARDARETLVAHLRDRRALLVLDNFEQVIEAASLLTDLLARCPQLAVLATSRTALRVRAEQQFRVGPLATPPAGAPVGADLSAFAAVRLFVARAQAVRPAFQPDAEAIGVVARICRQLDGLPLAIELAAARVALLPPAALLARLEQRLQVLKGGPRDLPERQQTLRATIDWSHALLDAAEQALFRRLSVFAGGCTLEAAEAVCAPDATIDVLNGVESLVNKSLVRSDDEANTADDGDGGPRLDLLETLREYARERLDAEGEAAQMRHAHAAYYLHLVETTQRDVVGPRQRAWLQRLEREHDNLRAALAWCLEREDGEMGLRLGGALWRFWYMRGHLSEGRAWLERLLERLSTTDPLVRAEALRGAGGLAVQQGDLQRAVALGEECLTLYRDMGQTQGVADMLNMLGNAAREQVEYERALALYEESLALYRELGDTQGIAVVLNNLGTTARYHGDLARAAAMYAQSLPLRQGLNDTRGVALTFVNMGALARAQGDLDQSAARYAEGLTLGQTVGDSWIVASGLQGLAEVAQAEGLSRRAAQLLGAAAALRATLGSLLTPVERAAYERTEASVRAALGAAAFAEEWAQGHTLPLDAVVRE